MEEPGCLSSEVWARRTLSGKSKFRKDDPEAAGSLMYVGTKMVLSMTDCQAQRGQ